MLSLMAGPGDERRLKIWVQRNIICFSGERKVNLSTMFLKEKQMHMCWYASPQKGGGVEVITLLSSLEQEGKTRGSTGQPYRG